MENIQTLRDLAFGLYDAYDYFNRTLFSNLLPAPCITFELKSESINGTFYPERFHPIEGDEAELKNKATDGISLNPAKFTRTEMAVFSTLVHEMVHQWEEHYGDPPKSVYHNKSWAEKMKQIGLHPSSTGEPGGKETGRKMAHYIIPNGEFEIAAKEYLATTGFKIDWVAILPLKPKKKTSRKVAYRCECDRPVYANTDDVKMTCNDCGKEFVPDVL